MTICDDLRQSVLQAAIQGKLTKQLPEDGTAADLLASIKAEKEKLIKEKKIKKEKPLAPISEDEIPFDIPENWEWVQLKDISSILGGKRIPAGSKLSEDKTAHKYIRVADMKNGTVLLNDIKYVPDSIYPQIKNYTISKDDVYITVAGTIGRVGLIPEELDNANLTENANKIVLLGNISKYWLKNTLNAPLIQGLISSATTKMAQPKLAILRIETLPIPLPPLAEQHRIVARVNELMAKIDELETVEKELVAIKKAFPEDMKTSLLQAAMQGKLTQQFSEDGSASDLSASIKAEKEQLIKEKKIKKEKPLAPISVDEIPFDIPDNWEWVKLGECISLLSGQDMKPEEYNSSGIGTVYLTGASNIENGKIIINRWTTVPKAIAHKGDILLTCKGTIGTMCVLKEQKVHIARQIMAITPHVILREYVMFFLKSYVETLKSKAKSMIPGIERKNVLNAVMPLPPLAEQQRIVEKLDKLLPLCDALKEDDVA